MINLDRNLAPASQMQRFGQEAILCLPWPVYSDDGRESNPQGIIPFLHPMEALDSPFQQVVHMA